MRFMRVCIAAGILLPLGMGLAPRPALACIDSFGSPCIVPVTFALQSIATGNVDNQLNQALGETAQARALPVALYPTGRLARTTHDGYHTTINGVPFGRSPGFKTDEWSLFGTLEFNPSNVFGAAANWKINLFGGVAEIDATYDAFAGFNRNGSWAKNHSNVFGASSILSSGSSYMVTALTGFNGETDGFVTGTRALADNKFRYGVSGVVGNMTVGHSFAIGGDWFFDPRVGFVYSSFHSDDYPGAFSTVVSNVHQQSASVSGSVGVFARMNWGGMSVGPYARAGLESRVHYSNTALDTPGGGTLVFGDDDTFYTASAGINIQFSNQLSFNLEGFGRWSGDSETLGGKTALKIRF